MKIDSVIVYNPYSFRRLFELKKSIHQLEFSDITQYTYVLYFNKNKKVCITSDRHYLQCDTTEFKVIQDVKCKGRKFSTILSYHTCREHGLCHSVFSTDYPCCRVDPLK